MFYSLPSLIKSTMPIFVGLLPNCSSRFFRRNPRVMSLYLPSLRHSSPEATHEWCQDCSSQALILQSGWFRLHVLLGFTEGFIHFSPSISSGRSRFKASSNLLSTGRLLLSPGVSTNRGEGVARSVSLYSLRGT